MSRTYSRENTSSKMKGAGDGIKSRPSERVPVPSSRKFTATPIKDDSVQLKLKKVLDEIDAKQGKLKKAKSVAEITPTKSKPKRPTKVEGALHATPRGPAETPSRRRNSERRLAPLVQRRMLLFVWRRSRERVAMLSDSLRRRQDQILQLEKQVNCLKDLTQSECEKRNEVIQKLQHMEKIVQNVKEDNENLNAEKKALEKEVDGLRNILENSSTDLENVKNDVNSKNLYLKHLEHEIQKEKLLVRNMKEEKLSILTKMKTQEVVIKQQKETNEQLRDNVKNLEIELKNAEEKIKMQMEDFNHLIENHQWEIRKNESLKKELMDAHSDSEELRRKLISLEEKIANLNDSFGGLMFQNHQLKEELEEKKLWNRTKNFISISWIVLQNAAYIMLPAL